jgi:membrane-associated phospholipid phosphatase
VACLVGYSRVYLSQHFLIDAVTGSAIGVIVVLVYYFYHLKLHGNWLDQSILMLFTRKNKN